MDTPRKSRRATSRGSGFWLARWTRIAERLILGLLVIKVAAVLATGPMSIEYDAAHYWKLAGQVSSGDLWMTHEPVAYRTPFYPWMVAGARALGDRWGLSLVVIVQGIVAIATQWLAGSLAIIVTGQRVARVGVLIVGLTGVASTTFARAVLTETWFAFLLTAHLYAQACYFQSPRDSRLIGSSILLSLTILTRPVSMLLWIIHAIGILAVNKNRVRRSLLLIICVALPLVPWIVRNHYLFGKPSLTEFVGRNLWIVTFQDQAGAGLEWPIDASTRDVHTRLGPLRSDDRWRLTWDVSDALVASGMTDAEADRAMIGICLRAIGNSPDVFAVKGLKRIINFWRCVSTHVPYPTDQPEKVDGQRLWGIRSSVIAHWLDHRWSLSVGFNTTVAAILVVSLGVLILEANTRRWGLWILAILVYFSSITGLLEIPAYRYRMIVEPLISVAVVTGGLVICRWLLPREQETSNFRS